MLKQYCLYRIRQESEIQKTVFFKTMIEDSLQGNSSTRLSEYILFTITSDLIYKCSKFHVFNRAKVAILLDNDIQYQVQIPAVMKTELNLKHLGVLEKEKINPIILLDESSTFEESIKNYFDLVVSNLDWFKRLPDNQKTFYYDTQFRFNFNAAYQSTKELSKSRSNIVTWAFFNEFARFGLTDLVTYFSDVDVFNELFYEE